jgi:hypothetical protein
MSEQTAITPIMTYVRMLRGRLKRSIFVSTSRPPERSWPSIDLSSSIYDTCSSVLVKILLSILVKDLPQLWRNQEKQS